MREGAWTGLGAAWRVGPRGCTLPRRRPAAEALRRWIKSPERSQVECHGILPAVDPRKTVGTGLPGVLRRAGRGFWCSPSLSGCWENPTTRSIRPSRFSLSRLGRCWGTGWCWWSWAPQPGCRRILRVRMAQARRIYDRGAPGRKGHFKAGKTESPVRPQIAPGSIFGRGGRIAGRGSMYPGEIGWRRGRCSGVVVAHVVPRGDTGRPVRQPGILLGLALVSIGSDGSDHSSWSGDPVALVNWRRAGLGRMLGRDPVLVCLGAARHSQAWRSRSASAASSEPNFGGAQASPSSSGRTSWHGPMIGALPSPRDCLLVGREVRSSRRVGGAEGRRAPSAWTGVAAHDRQSGAKKRVTVVTGHRRLRRLQPCCVT